jgi:hypothetical protein
MKLLVKEARIEEIILKGAKIEEIDQLHRATMDYLVPRWEEYIIEENLHRKLIWRRSTTHIIPRWITSCRDRKNIFLKKIYAENLFGEDLQHTSCHDETHRATMRITEALWHDGGSCHNDLHCGKMARD